MPDDPDFTIQRGSGDRQRPGGSSNPPVVSPQAPPQVATPSVPPGSQSNKTPIGHKLVTRYPGRQPLHDLPRFNSDNLHQDAYCALSGYHMRKFKDVFGKETVAGTLPSLSNGGSIVRDIPAWHEPSSGCLIIIKKKKYKKKQS
jgi:hypothetical protein